ncbi:uncharacterized protein LOC143028142 isoform X2 [Oratosquilla oratoria]|uniref:uncharacterized protein LOC143028142 isoform X2 n=1 Tax=Oratosquilla oratoria TaxID=337810 RepID=UPI003F766CAA
MIFGGKFDTEFDGTLEEGADVDEAEEAWGDGDLYQIERVPLPSVYSFRNGTGDGSTSGGGAATAFFNGLGLLIAMMFAALAIILIALVITKMRRRQSSDSTESIEMEMPTDPYLQAIMFPSEPRPEWHRHLRSMLHKAGQKIFRKQSEAHDTTIPEDLRYQLKQIYVY